MQTRLIDVPGAGRQGPAPAWHTLSAEDVLRAEGADPRLGLSSAEAASRVGRFGPNALAAGRAEPRWRAFIRQYSDPMQIVLLAAGLLSLYPLNQLGTGLLLILLTLANAVLGLQQEGEAESAVAALQRRLIVTVRVRRDGQESQIRAEQLVPGDVVSIEAGDVVPADGRLLRAAALEVAESELTGESVPVSKGTAPVGEADMPLGDRTDMVYMNTSVTRGTGELVVTATGMATEVGHISGMLEAQSAVKTPLTRQLAHLSRQLLLVAGVALITSMAVNLSRGYTFNAVLPAAVAFAIAAVPVQLPMVVTTILAWGTRALVKVGAIMKQLPSTETLGSTSAINTDKTGTLTLNQMTAVQMTVAGHRFAVEGRGYSTHGRINRVAGQAEIPLDRFLMPMVLASDAVLSDGELIGDPTEGALVALAAKGGIDAVSTRQVHPRIAELPFDAEYKLMATFHEMTGESGKAVIRCFVKGAPDQLLARATTVLDPDAGPVRLDGPLRERYLADNHRFAAEGLRVMATARRDFDPADVDPGADLLPLVTDLELLALVGIVDPPRPGAKASVRQAKSAGIEVRMITGDHAVTAAAIARQLGIDGKVISGAEFGAMTDDEAMSAIADVGVIARVTPEHKVRLVDMLKREGRIVAMTGDGVNDAPALKKADIGIAMGETGTEVAKQAAVMVLTDDNFSTITKAVEIGRGLYDNLVRYIRFEMGCMFGFIITFLGASIVDIAHGEPLLPLQVLWVAFTTVTIQSIGLGYSRPVEGLMERRPRPPSQPILSGGVLSWLVTVGLVMAIGTLSVVRWAEQAHSLATARTMGVVVFSLFNLFFSIESRHRRKSAFSLSTFADRTWIMTTGASVFLLVMATVLVPCQAILKTTALDADQWLICAAVALSIVAVTEIRKAFLRQTVGPVRLRCMTMSIFPTARLGGTGMDLTRVGFGAWAIGGAGWAFAWGNQDDAASVAAIRHAVESGINWIDTAAVYGLGHSEEVVAAALAGLPEADRPYVFTKGGNVWDPADRAAAPRRVGAPASIRTEVEASLRRLRVERIDLYQMHWPPRDGTPLEEYWQVFTDLKREGKIRAAGLSNHGVSQLEAAERIAAVDAIQPPFNLIHRDTATDILPWAHQHGAGVIVYSPMASGLLTGAFTAKRAASLEPGDWRARHPDFTEPALPANLALAQALRPVASRHGVTPAAVAVAWTLAFPGVTGAIVGARSPRQVDGWLSAASLELKDADLSDIAAAIRGTGAGTGPASPPAA